MTKNEIVNQSGAILELLKKAVEGQSFKQAANLAEEMMKVIGDYLANAKVKGKCC